MKPVIAVLALVLAPPLAAVPWAELGLGGTVVPGAWTPLRLSVPPETGPWTLKVTAQSASGHTSEVVTTHPAGGVSEEPLYVAAGARSLRLHFETSTGSRDLEVPLAGRLFPGHVIAVDGLDATDEAELSDVLLPLEPVKVVALPPSQWPTSVLSYGGLAALVARDPGTIAPTRRDALRAWVASGGVLVIAGRLPEGMSLLDQVATEGAGRAVEAPANGNWRRALNLRPYGQLKRWGTDFDPPPSVGSLDSPVLKASLAFILVWAIGVVAVRKRRDLKIPLMWAGACSAAAVLVALVWATWDHGLSVHGRELEVGALGRFTSFEAVRSGRQAPLDWPGSPWALPAWRQEANPGWARSADADRFVFDAFLSPVVRVPSFQARWADHRVRWYEASDGRWTAVEDVPTGWRRDEAWIKRMVLSYPERVWSGGVDGNAVWLRPEGVSP